MDEDAAAPEAAPREAVTRSAAAEPAREDRRASTSTTPLPVERPRPAVVSAAPKPMPIPTAEAEAAPPKRPAFDGTTGHSTVATATPSSLRWVVGPQPVRMGDRDIKQVAKIEMRATDEPRASEKGEARAEKIEARADKIEARVEKIEARAPESTGSVVEAVDRPAVARSGWMIQIGATDDADKAHALLARAKAEGPRSLGRATPFTEKFQKGSATFYRARFAGLQAETAEAACKSLKRSGFACFATKN
jgi:D-alanyl-D-alanine carboxypeptidase